MCRYFKRMIGFGNGNFINFWTSEGLSFINITLPITLYRLNPKLSSFGTRTSAEFNQSCLKQNKGTYNHGKIVNIYIY